jgi:hypothetical protein
MEEAGLVGGVPVADLPGLQAAPPRIKHPTSGASINVRRLFFNLRTAIRDSIYVSPGFDSQRKVKSRCADRNP